MLRATTNTHNTTSRLESAYKPVDSQPATCRVVAHVFRVYTQGGLMCSLMQLTMKA
jgi:hypothetical protein